MKLKKGTVVYSLCGHDKNTFLVVLDFNDKYVLVCDGKYRLLEKPKKKNIIHVKLSNTVLSESDMSTDRSVKAALRKFNESVDTVNKI